MEPQKVFKEFKQHFDGVIVFAFSDWETELRTNRYIYTTRFARHLPVLFVQSTLDEENKVSFIKKAQTNIYLLKISKKISFSTYPLLLERIKEMGFIAPLVWLYNYHLAAFLITSGFQFIAYHATEDYTSSYFNLSKLDYAKYIAILKLANLSVAVSKEIYEKISKIIVGKNEVIQIENGCDYSFWHQPHRKTSLLGRKKHIKHVIYQGSITKRFDFKLVEYLVKELPAFGFHFVGQEGDKNPLWPKLLDHKNVYFYGKREPEFVRDLCHQMDVGLVPFRQEPEVVNALYPLKIFEYIASGLPVVSVPLLQLQKYSDVINFCSTYEEFKTAILRTDKQDEQNALRFQYAKAHDYDQKFMDLILKINHHYILGSKTKEERGIKFSDVELRELAQFDASHIKAVSNPLKRVMRKLIFTILDYIPPKQSSKLKYCILNLSEKIRFKTY